MASLRRNPKGTWFADYRWRGRRYRKSLRTKDAALARERFNQFCRTTMPRLRLDPAARRIEDVRRAYIDGHLASHPKHSRINAGAAFAAFEAWCAEQDIVHVRDVTSDLVMGFSGHLFSTGRSAGTVATYLSYIRAAWRRCDCPAIKWPSVSRPRPAIEVLTAEQVAEVFAAVHRYAPHIEQALRFLAATGWRIGDVLSLRHEHLDMPLRRAVRRQGKTGRGLGVQLNLDALRAIAAARTATGYVFQFRPGRPISDATFRHGLRRACETAGIAYRVHAHLFRHTLATRLAAQGAPVAVVQHLLGHASPATTYGAYQHYMPGSEQAWIESYRADAQTDGHTLGTPKIEASRTKDLR